MATAFEQFGQVLGNRSIAYRDEPFELRGGGMSNWYVDLREGHSVPALLRRTGRYVLGVTSDAYYNTVAGIGIDGRAVVSGVVWATQERPNRQHVVARWGNDSASERPIAEEPKNGRGFYQPDMVGRHVLAVDGAFTTGNSLSTLVDMIRDADGIVTDAAVVVDRSGGASAEVANSLGVNLHVLFDFSEARGQLTPRQ